MGELEPLLDGFDICARGLQQRERDWYPGEDLEEELARGLSRSWRPRILEVHEA